MTTVASGGLLKSLLAGALSACLAVSPSLAADAAAGAGEPAAAAVPLRVLSISPIRLPWNATRSSWEQTKDASSRWHSIPLAQIATAAFFLKTAVSAPYDLLAAPFRQKTRSKVRFEIRGRLVGADGKPAAKAKLTVRCEAPLDEDPDTMDYYETGRFGPVLADGDGRVLLQGKGLTGVAPKFLVHLDLEDGPTGTASAGAYAVVLTTAGASIAPVLDGAARLVSDPEGSAPVH